MIESDCLFGSFLQSRVVLSRGQRTEEKRLYLIWVLRVGYFFSCYAIWPLAQLWVIEFTPLLGWGWGWGWQRFNHTLHSHAERQLKVRSTVLPTALISFFAMIKHSDQTQHKGRKGIIQLKIPCHSPSLKEAVYSTQYYLPPRNSLYSQRNKYSRNHEGCCLLVGSQANLYSSRFPIQSRVSGLRMLSQTVE